jgi:hypothetical protein
MKNMLLLLLLIAFLISILAGCAAFLSEPRLGAYQYTHQELYTGSPYRTIPIWVDINFGESDRMAIDDAVRSWNYALNGYIVLNIVDLNFDMEPDKVVKQVAAGGWLFMKINRFNPIVVDIDKTKEGGRRTLAFTERVGGYHLYLIRDRLSNDAIYGVTMHEMGHLLGTDHVGDRLMNPTYTKARFQCIDHDSLWMVASYQKIPMEHLNYCFDKNGVSLSSDDVPIIVEDFKNIPLGL